MSGAQMTVRQVSNLKRDRHLWSRVWSYRVRRGEGAVKSSTSVWSSRASGTRSAAPRACLRGPPRANSQGLASPVRGGPDAYDAGRSEPGIHRTRRHPRATMCHLPRTDRDQPRRLAQSRRPVRGGDLQAALGLPVRSTRERGDVAFRGIRTFRILRPTTSTCRGFRRTIPRRNCRSPGSWSTARPCAVSRLAAPATAAWTTRLGVLGSRASRRST